MNPYETLGVPRDASPDQVKRAYRARAHKAHPDRPGGTDEAFHQVQVAHDILIDPSRRKAYDEHGHTGPAPDQRQMVTMAIATMVVSLVESGVDLEHTDLKAQMVAGVRQTIEQMHAARRAGEEKIARQEKAMARFRRKGGGDNVLAQLLEGRIRELRGGLAIAEQQLELARELIAVLEEYSYQVEPLNPYANAQQQAAWGSPLASMLGGFG